MPTYNSVCNTCKKQFEYFSRISERDMSPLCCDAKTERVLLTPPPGYVDHPHFMKQYKHMY